MGLVPHYFRQYYVADNSWLEARAVLGRGNIRSVTRAGLAPEITTLGEDFDTFLQPDGDVVTSGTTGDVRLQSWRLEQRLVVHLSPHWSTSIRYGIQRDRARFLPATRIVTHTQPASIDESIVTTRETTISTMHEVGLGIAYSRLAGRWRVTGRLDVAPLVLGRLTVRLPDKYPDVDLHFGAVALGAAGSIAAERPLGPLTLVAEAGYTHATPYRQAARLERRTTHIAVGAAWRH